MKKKATGTSYAKIIFFGEHSVVYGKPAIAIPVYSVNVTVAIKLISVGQTIHCRYFDGPISEMADNLKGIGVLIRQLLKSFNSPDLPFELTIQSKVPSERGMDSSAATAVALVRGFFNLFEKPLTRSRLLALADVEEQITHGNPSGLDAATASSEAPIWFVKNQINEQIEFHSSDLFLVIADSGIKGKTSEAVSLVHNNVVTNSDVAVPLIDQLGTIADSAKDALASADKKQLGMLMNQSQHHLSKLGVSTDTLDDFCRIAVANNALGAKLTGSGLGGCMISLTDNQRDAQIISTKLRQAGATQTWIQSFENYEYSTGEAHDNLVN